MNDFRNTSETRRRTIDLAIQNLRSPRNQEVNEGIKSLFELIDADSEDVEVYDLLIRSAQQHPNLRASIEGRLHDQQRDSPSAQRALRQLQQIKDRETSAAADVKSPNDLSVDELIAKSDDAYYAAEYGKAIQLYEQVIEKDPENEHAKRQITKARLREGGERVSQSIPREAVKFYRRARSFLNAKDIREAASLLEEAIEASRKEGQHFPEAEALLESLDDARAAVEFMDKAEQAMRGENWDEAYTQLTYVLRLGHVCKIRSSFV